MPWLAFEPTTGTVPPGGSLDVTVIFDARTVGVGSYSANILIGNNDPDEDIVAIPASFTMACMGGDETSGDGIYTVQIGPFAAETVVEYQVLAKDIDGNEVLWPSFPFSFEVLPPFNPENDILLVVDSTWSGDVNFIAPFYRDALNDLGLTFDFWDTSLRVIVDVDTLN